MTSYYSIIQYIPDAVRNEAVNLGVVTYGDAQKPLRTTFLQNWQRVRCLADEAVDIGALRRRLLLEAAEWDEATIVRLAGHWTGSVQLTKPAASLLNPDDLLVDIARRILPDDAPAKGGRRAKVDAVRIMKKQVGERLSARFGPAGRVYLRKKGHAVAGHHMSYEFDVSVGNGQPIFAMQGLSFEIPESRRLTKEISATAWLIEDVKRSNSALPIGVMVLAPDHPTKVYDQARTTFAELSADVLNENEVSDWAGNLVELMPEPGQSES